VAKLVEYDVSGVEASSGGGGDVEAKPSVYPARIAVCETRAEKRDGTPANDIRVALDLGENYAWLWTYIGLGEASDLKLAEFTRAIKLKEKGKFDPAKLVNTIIRVKVNPDSYEGQYKARAGRLLPATDGDAKLDLHAVPSGGDNGAGPTAVADDDEPTDEADGYEAIREEDDNSYEDWPEDDVEAEFTDRGLTAPGGRGNKLAKMITALRADDEAALSSDGDEDEGGGGIASGENEDDYDDWQVSELETEAEGRALDLPKKPRGSGAAERFKEAIIALLREDDEANPFEPEAD
jgi:hypothetical protein